MANFGAERDDPDRVPIPDCLSVAEDTSVADWALERLWAWKRGSFRVGCLVPDRFAAYGRILHPGYRVAGNVGTMRWATLADMAGRVLGPETGFSDATGIDPADQRAAHDASPSDGNLPRHLVASLVPILKRQSRADRVWYAMWDGSGWGDGVSYDAHDDPAEQRRAVEEAVRYAERRRMALARLPRIRIPDRVYYLFSGPIGCAASLGIGDRYQSANMWWPEDHAWFVHTEVDGYSSYVGASRACIDELVGSAEVEVIEVEATSRVPPDYPWTGEPYDARDER
jgi:hypothetical protein